MANGRLMLNIKRCNSGMIASLLLASAALVGCAPKTNVSATGNVPAQYSHVYMTIQAIWFNTSATAGPDDTTWIKFPLKTAVTVDLAASMGGTLNSITTGLAVPIGTYAQVRLIPVDGGVTALTSATNLGALYNSEVDYTDSSGKAQQARLELQNPEKGIGIATSIQVKGTGTNVFGSTSSSSSNSSTSTSGTSSSTSSKPFTLAINFDGSKDLVPFTYAGTIGTSTAGSVTVVNGVSTWLLNPHMTGYDTGQAGAIQGTLDLTNVSTLVSGQSNSSLADIQVTAESLSTDGSRHVAVNSAPVSISSGGTTGTFTLYPLATSTSSPTSYDLVIHGPAIETIIVKGVTVNVGDPSTTTPVNIGTITPLAAPSSSSIKVNLNTTTPLSGGALVGFYQTISAANEVPYLIEQRPVNPFTRAFDSDLTLPGTQIQYGTFSSSGSTVGLTTADPAERAAFYRVAASAPLFADGAFTNPVTGITSATTQVPVPTLLPASGVVSPATTVTLNQANQFDQGDLIISHDGAIVTTVNLNSALQRSGTSTLAITGLPAGGGTASTPSSALYYVSVRAWKSTDPVNTLTRETFPNPLDLRTTTSIVYTLTIN